MRYASPARIAHTRVITDSAIRAEGVFTEDLPESRDITDEIGCMLGEPYMQAALIKALVRKVRSNHYETNMDELIIVRVISGQRDAYDNYLRAEVIYNQQRDWRATFGGKWDGDQRRFIWETYMD